MRIAVIGAGAAGCFCAIGIRRRLPEAEVVIYESGSRPLAKVAVTGGGRCNLTNSFADAGSLSSIYPRGWQLMKRALKRFSNRDVMEWFEAEGVRLVVQDDQCVFPESQDAMQIVITLLRLLDRYGVVIHTDARVTSLMHEGTFTVSGEGFCESYDKVVVTTGGSPKMSGMSFLSSLDLEIESPVPSLFTFNVKDKSLTSLMGAVVEKASVSIQGTRFKASGPLLVTDWGLSGPATLKLSSYAARYLADCQYRSPLSVHWLGERTEQEVRDILGGLRDENTRRQVTSTPPEGLTSRLWEHIVTRSALRPGIRWGEVGSRGFNRLVSTIVGDSYMIEGRGHFKDEFVTCGGVALSGISLNTLECKTHQGLFFAGEALDIDAITGGFNLQAAWTTGWIVAQSI